MMLNVNAIRDFGTLLHAIPFDMLTTQDFYCSIRSFYVGLLARLVNDYGKNNLYIINIAHSFKNFLQTCNFVEPLPDGMAQFMGMMASIIRDMYHIDLDLVELKQTSKEMKEEGPLSIQEVSMLKPEDSKEEEESVMDQEELWDIYKEIKMRTGEKKWKREAEHYEMQVECLFEKMMKDGNGGFDDEMKAKMVEALREDEREIQVKKMKLQGDLKEEKKKKHQIL